MTAELPQPQVSLQQRRNEIHTYGLQVSVFFFHTSLSLTFYFILENLYKTILFMIVLYVKTPRKKSDGMFMVRKI